MVQLRLDDVLEILGDLQFREWKGVLRRRPIKVVFNDINSMGGSLGLYHFGGGKPWIEVSTGANPFRKGLNLTNTLAHELGHWLDDLAGTIADPSPARRAGVEEESWDYYTSPTEVRARAFATVINHCMNRRAGEEPELHQHSPYGDADEAEYRLVDELYPLIGERVRSFFEKTEKEAKRIKRLKSNQRWAASVRDRAEVAGWAYLDEYE